MTPPPPPPNCAWGWPCHAPSVGWAPPPREEEAVVWNPQPDLEAPPPPPAIPGATDELEVDCSAESFTVINFLREGLVILWVGMIFAMVHYAWSHYHEKGWGTMVMFEFLIAIGVTPCFGIAAQVLDDVESRQ